MTIAIAQNGRAQGGNFDQALSALIKDIPAVFPRDKSVKNLKLKAGQSQ